LPTAAAGGVQQEAFIPQAVGGNAVALEDGGDTTVTLQLGKALQASPVPPFDLTASLSGQLSTFQFGNSGCR
jgi:hypothetical protein